MTVETRTSHLKVSVVLMLMWATWTYVTRGLESAQENIREACLDYGEVSGESWETTRVQKPKKRRGEREVKRYGTLRTCGDNLKTVPPMQRNVTVSRCPRGAWVKSEFLNDREIQISMKILLKLLF